MLDKVTKDGYSGTLLIAFGLDGFVLDNVGVWTGDELGHDVGTKLLQGGVEPCRGPCIELLIGKDLALRRSRCLPESPPTTNFKILGKVIDRGSKVPCNLRSCTDSCTGFQQNGAAQMVLRLTARQASLEF